MELYKNTIWPFRLCVGLRDVSKSICKGEAFNTKCIYLNIKVSYRV